MSEVRVESEVQRGDDRKLRISSTLKKALSKLIDRLRGRNDTSCMDTSHPSLTPSHLNRLPPPNGIRALLDDLQHLLAGAACFSDPGELLQRGALHVAGGQAGRGGGVDTGDAGVLEPCEDAVEHEGLPRPGTA